MKRRGDASPSTIAPHEATLDDVMAAVAAAGEATRERGDYMTAWAMAEATGANHLRAVLRGDVR